MQARQIELKEVGEHGAFKYRELLTLILNRPSNPQVGMSLKEIRQCNKILDKIEAANGSILLTEEEWRMLHERVEAFPFGLGGRDIQQFGDDIAHAPMVELGPVAV